GDHVAGQQAAVGAAAHRQVVAVGDTALDEVAGDGGEVLVGAVPVLLQRRLVPAGPVLAAAADVGQHIGSAALQPRLADRSQVAGGQGDLEAAVAEQQGRGGTICAPGRGVLPGDLEVGHPGAVVAGGEVLDHVQAARVEPCGCGPGQLRSVRVPAVGDIGQVAQQQRGRLDEVGGGHPDLVVLVGVDGGHAQGAAQLRVEVTAHPGAVRVPGMDLETVDHVVEDRQHHGVAGDGH